MEWILLIDDIIANTKDYYKESTLEQKSYIDNQI